MVDGAPRASAQAEILTVAGSFAVTPRGPLLGEPTQELHLGQPVGARVRRQLRRHQRQIESRLRPHLGGDLDHPRIPGETAQLFGTTAHVRRCRRRQPRIHVVQTAPLAHRRHGGGQTTTRRRRVVHVVGGHATHVGARRQFGQGVVAGTVERFAVIPQLDEHAIATERVGQPLQFAQCHLRTVLDESTRDDAAMITGEDPPPVVRVVGQQRQRASRFALAPRQLGQAERARQVRVTRGSVGQHHQSTGPTMIVDRDVAAEDGGQSHRARGLGEAHHAVEAVVVGDGQRRQLQALGFLHQLLGVRRSGEEGEVGVAVKFGVGHHRTRRAA